MEITLKSVYDDRNNHYGLLYAWLNERLLEPQTNISHTSLPSYTQHCQFVDSIPYKLYEIVYDGKVPIGYVYVSQNNEIGIYISKYRRGNGVGKKVIELIKEDKDCKGKLFANINPNNEASIKFFESFGFKHIQNTYALDVSQQPSGA